MPVNDLFLAGPTPMLSRARSKIVSRLEEIRQAQADAERGATRYAVDVVQ